MPQSGSPFPALPIKGDVDTGETQKSKKRSSSVGSAFRRLFSKSPAVAERSSSDHSVSLLGTETPLITQESVVGAGLRGRTPPKVKTPSPITPHSTTLTPNNPFYVPVDDPNIDSYQSKGGLRAQQLLLRAPMASHRGTMEYDTGGQFGGPRRAQSTDVTPLMIKGKPMLLVKFRIRRRSPSLSIISSRLDIRQHLRLIHSFKLLMPSTIVSRQAIKRRLKIKLLKTLNWVNTLNWLKVPVLKLEPQLIEVRRQPELLHLATRLLQWS